VSDHRFLAALQVELLRHAELDDERRDHLLFQTSTIDAILDGHYDGDVTLAELLDHGDHGLGTVEALDGELVVIDGVAWRARADASLDRPSPDTTIPYAVVVPFRPGAPVALDGPLGLDALAAGLSASGEQRLSAVRVDGRFATVRVRSLPRQARPYRPLAEVVATDQVVTELGEVAGSLVGFRFPDPLGGIEMAGWHLHFVTADRARGGHVLDCELLDGTAHVDHASELHVELPPAVEAAAGRPGADPALLRRIERGES
jgi:acetolactate decarboxylase